MSRAFLSVYILSLAILLLLTGTADALSGQPGPQTPAPSGRIIVKFTDDSGLEIRDGILSRFGKSGLGASSEEALRVDRLLAEAAPQYTLTRHFSRSSAQIDAERQAAEARSGRQLPNLNRYARLEPAGSPTEGELLAILETLLADPAVETAFLEPKAVPAALGFDAFTGEFNPADAVIGPTMLRSGDPVPPTPDFTPDQGYLDAAPTGVDAEGVWGEAGGEGQSVKVLDIEGAWKWEHEDLPSPFFTAGGEVNSESWRNHGTAVVGEIRGITNGYGITGISHEVSVGGVSIAELSVADAINTCAANLDEGDIFLIELHAPGPNANGSGQHGYVCMEYWQDNFDAILLATANGRICCEAAGNGEQNFDDPIYMGLFDRDVRDSGAIMCGASNGASLDPAWFSNHGERVDLHGWGYDVVTTGYGNLQGGDETEWYTDSFSGTSSASPIVVGSVASLQGMVKAAYGIPLSAKLARDILVATGTPQNGSNHIGPRPNLTAAWVLAQTGIGEVAGVVTDAGSGDPIAECLITVEETGAFVLTDVSGAYRVPLLVDSYTLKFESYFHLSGLEPVTVSAGATTVLNVALETRQLVDIRGYTYLDDGATPLENVRVTPSGAPIGSTVSDEDGRWLLSGFPAGRTYYFRFDNLPGYGADFDSIEIPEVVRSEFSLISQLSVAAEDFESGAGGFTGDPIWELDTPSAGGPSAGFSGVTCWGVGMHENYGDDVYGTLTSPSYDFSAEDVLLLSFHYWCETESGFDGTNVQVWSVGAGGWVTVAPFGGYPSVSLSGIGYEHGWSGSTGGWEGAVFDVSAFASDEFAFRLQFGSDGGVDGVGFWIDEVAFNFGDAVSAAPAADLDLRTLRLTASSPTRDVSQIHLALPQPTELDLSVYDGSGRLVRNLHNGWLPAGQSLLRWDGRDRRGQTAPNGVYFLRVSAENQTPYRTGRIVIAR